MKKDIRTLVIALVIVYGIGIAMYMAGVKLPFFPQGTKTTSTNVADAFAPHKALYDFHMISSESGSGISGIKGQMFYSQDDVCDAWTAEHRFRTTYQYPEQKPVLNTSSYVAWEAKDQSQFHFKSERRENDVVTEDLRGALVRKADGTATADYLRPEGLSFTLPRGYMLPTFQTNEIIRRARKGDVLFDAVMFDGTDADGPVTVNTFIGKKATAEEIAAYAGNARIDAKLLVDAWHVRLAIFSLAEKESMYPMYEIEMVLHANGVVSHVVIDYKTFKVEQTLLALEPLPPKNCP